MNLAIRIVVFALLLAAVGAIIWLGVENVRLRRADAGLESVSRETGLSTAADSLATQDEAILANPVQRMRKFYEEREDTQPDLGIVDEDLRRDLANRRKKERFMAQFEPDGAPVGRDHYVTQTFSDEHPAVDYATPEGDNVYAIASGVVRDVFIDQYYGRVMIVDHLNGYASLYAHLKESFEAPGRFVEKGQTIALVGNTGNSTAPHLHLEIWFDGVQIDPQKLIDEK